jgi:hypothetical protein
VEDNFGGIEPAVAQAAENMIAAMQIICKEKGRKFEYNASILRNTLEAGYRYINVADSRQRTIKVASTIAAGIIARRPFTYFSNIAGLHFVNAYLKQAGFPMQEDRFREMRRQVFRMLDYSARTETELLRMIEIYLYQSLR